MMLDYRGYIAESTGSNVFFVKDGALHTPTPDCFLNGITRQRVVGLLRGAGVSVVETTLTWKDFLDADEIFSAGNFSKLMPVIRIEQRELQPGPIFRKARELYWAFAHGK